MHSVDFYAMDELCSWKFSKYKQMLPFYKKAGAGVLTIGQHPSLLHTDEESSLSCETHQECDTMGKERTVI